ncbi:MAG: Cytosol aminopeptidase [Pseudomonadota bacterium]
MQFEILSRSLNQALQGPQDALLVMWSDGAGQSGVLADWVAQARARGDFKDTAGAVLQSYGMPGVKPRHLVLVATGPEPREVRKALRAAWGSLKADGIQRLAVQWVGAELSAASLHAIATELADASYSYTATLSQAKPRALRSVQIGLPQVQAAQRQALSRAQATVRGIELAKEWANRPANHATPSHLAKAAQALAKAKGVGCKVMGPREVQKLGMGAFLAVARGAVEPLRFIVLEYKGPKATGAPVVLVGKGITFDTGGISMKPAPEMDEMKFDMSGAASVLGVFQALTELQPAVHVVGLIPATENMPDGQAVKPGDVVTSMSGQTIEILNTDAEGRLVLCDALTYAERYKPRAVIDIATLTGACVIALGAHRSGLFSSDDALAQALERAGEASEDRCWRMPLDEDYAEGLKSRFADVANVGGRAAGSVTAAKFLQRFAGKFPWAHLDIAGTAWRSGAHKGATGRPVALLLNYLLDAQTPATAVANAGKGRTAKRRA